MRARRRPTLRKIGVEFFIWRWRKAGMLLKLTNLSYDTPQYFPVAKIIGITAGVHEFEGHASLWLGGADYIVVKESADEVAEIWSKTLGSGLRPRIESALEACLERMEGLERQSASKSIYKAFASMP
jgi:hypothetical protein